MIDNQSLYGGFCLVCYKICSFFGHRKIDITEELKQKLKCVIEDLIVNHNVQIFLFGSKSEFDELCHLLVTEIKESYPKIKRIVYTCKSESCILETEREKWERIYSNVFNKSVELLGVEEEFEHKTKYTAGKAGYLERNQAMIDNSEYCIFYYDKNYKPPQRKLSKSNLSFYQPQSGTSLAYKYAKQKQKVIINVL